MTNRILVVDDDYKLADFVKEFLEQHHYQVYLAHDGLKGLELFRTFEPDMVLLDLMLPELDGLEVCKTIRQSSQVPIIMLTAKGEESDKVIGLELGADDYIPKPFGLKELHARMRAVMRRHDKPAETAQSLIQMRRFSLNLMSHELIVEGRPQEITNSEFELLKLFVLHPGRVYSREELLERVRGRDMESFDRAMDMHISNLRKKIEPDPKKPVCIKTVWGVGYKFEDN